MTWNYRIILHEDEHPTGTDVWLGLHEVHYDQPDGAVATWCEEPAVFVGESPEEIVQALELALRDAKDKPVLLESSLKAASNAKVQ